MKKVLGTIFLGALILIIGVVVLRRPACCNQSYFSQPDFFDQAYRGTLQGAPVEGVKAIIVNHHLLASSYIAEAFNKVATTAPVTVLLVSPNHFSSGSGNIIASAEQWQTPYGKLQPNLRLIQNLSKQNVINIDEPPFEQEHGVSGIVPFIKKSLPSATIVPVIFNNRMTLVDAIADANKFAAILPSNTLIVGSFDFSHYLTSNAANFHDIKNLADVESFNIPDVYNLDIDSRPGLAFFLQLLKDQGNQKFTLLEHSNSAELTRRDILETTSYITGYFQAGPPATISVQTILSLGSIVPSIKPYTNPALIYLDRLFFGQDKTVIGPVNTGSGVVINRDAKQNAFAIEGARPVVYANPGLGVGVVYTATGTQIYLFPVGSDGGLLKLLIAPQSDKVLTDMAAASHVSPDLKSQIKKGIINIK